MFSRYGPSGDAAPEISMRQTLLRRSDSMLSIESRAEPLEPKLRSTLWLLMGNAISNRVLTVSPAMTAIHPIAYSRATAASLRSGLAGEWPDALRVGGGEVFVIVEMKIGLRLLQILGAKLNIKMICPNFVKYFYDAVTVFLLKIIKSRCSYIK